MGGKSLSNREVQNLLCEMRRGILNFVTSKKNVVQLEANKLADLPYMWKSGVFQFLPDGLDSKGNYSEEVINMQGGIKMYI